MTEIENQPNTMAKKPERNYGIDLLRIYSMFMVVIHHLLLHGGVLKATTGKLNSIAWFIELAAYCAVDVYALVSGYVGYTDKEKPFKTSKFLTMWVQVFCYSFGLTLVTMILKPECVSLKTLFYSAFPVSSNQYWYFSCYAALLLLMPWMNGFVRKLDKKELTKFVTLLAGAFSVYSLFYYWFAGTDPFTTAYGYSVAWLIILYFIGAWMKNCGVAEKIKSKTAWLVLFGSLILTWLTKIVIDREIFVGYTSPTILAIAICYVVIFAKLKTNSFSRKLIAFFAPAAFGVYLIHEQNIVRQVFITKFHLVFPMDSAWLLPIEVIGCALGILLICMLIEKLRLWLFKIMKINNLIDLIGKKIDKVLDIISKKIDRIFEKDSSKENGGQ